jgi:hypothetical protein|tara:strand:+ start:1229 stop:1840 length:612 start_codon:yes stop_codon:yes gene_type:complete
VSVAANTTPIEVATATGRKETGQARTAQRVAIRDASGVNERWWCGRCLRYVGLAPFALIRPEELHADGHDPAGKDAAQQVAGRQAGAQHADRRARNRHHQQPPSERVVDQLASSVGVDTRAESEQLREQGGADGHGRWQLEHHHEQGGEEDRAADAAAHPERCDQHGGRKEEPLVGDEIHHYLTDASQSPGVPKDSVSVSLLV